MTTFTPLTADSAFASYLEMGEGTLEMTKSDYTAIVRNPFILAPFMHGKADGFHKIEIDLPGQPIHATILMAIRIEGVVNRDGHDAETISVIDVHFAPRFDGYEGGALANELSLRAVTAACRLSQETGLHIGVTSIEMRAVDASMLATSPTRDNMITCFHEAPASIAHLAMKIAFLSIPDREDGLKMTSKLLEIPGCSPAFQIMQDAIQ